MLCAQDFAGNTSTPQTALVIKKISNTVTVNDSYAENSGSGEYSEGETVTVTALLGIVNVVSADLLSANCTPSSVVQPLNLYPLRSPALIVTVSFETNGGNDIASKTVTKNSVIKEPESPIKDGFDFEGDRKSVV